MCAYHCKIQQNRTLITQVLWEHERYNKFTLPQHIREVVMILLLDTKTVINFLNIRTASAPIQKTDAIVKYKIRTETAVQTTSFSVLSIPAANINSIKNKAMHSCACNLLISFTRSFLYNQPQQAQHVVHYIVLWLD